MKIGRAKAAYNLLINSVRTVVLGTVSSGGIPNVSYAPFVMDEAKNIYIFVSKLSVHTSNIQANARASLMLIEDETKSKQVFARRRLRYSCSVTTTVYYLDNIETMQCNVFTCNISQISPNQGYQCANISCSQA